MHLLIKFFSSAKKLLIPISQKMCLQAVSEMMIASAIVKAGREYFQDPAGFVFSTAFLN